MINKQTFLEMIDFIKEKDSQQDELVKIFEKMCPGVYCDTLVYAEYETKMLKLLAESMDDDSGLISYKFYEFDNFDESTQHEQLTETPELRSWETVYDYLVSQKEAHDKHAK